MTSLPKRPKRPNHLRELTHDNNRSTLFSDMYRETRAMVNSADVEPEIRDEYLRDLAIELLNAGDDMERVAICAKYQGECGTLHGY
jgi:hypothetical protein